MWNARHLTDFMKKRREGSQVLFGIIKPMSKMKGMYGTWLRDSGEEKIKAHGSKCMVDKTLSF